MRIVFVTDLHGCTWKYDRLFEVARAFQADVVVNSGDMLPKMGNLFHQDTFITQYLPSHFAQFEAAEISYLCYLGNDDLRIFDELFDATCNQYKFVHNIAQRKVSIQTIEFVGMNWVVDYPFRLKDRCRRDTDNYIFQSQLGTGLLSTLTGWKELDDWLAYAHTLPTIAHELDILVRPHNMEQSIYVIHMPPYRLGLDVCGNGQHVGSGAIYEFLQHYQPRLSLHGHIHESPHISGRWKTPLGNTMCIQPGQLDVFTYVTIDFDSMEIERYMEVCDEAQKRVGLS